MPEEREQYKTLTVKSKDSDIVARVEQERGRYNEEARYIRLQWLINSAFIRGKQWIVFDELEKSLVVPQLPKGRKRVTVNKLQSNSQHFQARLIAATPEYEVLPNDFVADEVMFADACKAFLNSQWERGNWREKQLTIAKYLYHFGNAFGYSNYIEDPMDLEEFELLDDDENPILDPEDGNPAVQKLVRGDVVTKILLPHHVMCSLDPSPLEEKTQVTLGFYEWVELVRRKYPDKADKIHPEALNAETNYDLHLLASNRGRERMRREGVNRFVRMQKPSEENPDGLIAVVANGVLLDKMVWPYKHINSFPIVHYHTEQPPGEFFGRAPVEDLLPIQKYTNLMYTIVLENADNMGHTRILNPDQSGIQEPADIAGEVIDYVAPYKPEVMEVKPLPHYMTNFPAAILAKEFDDASNFHNVSRGSGSTAVRSNVGINNLQEQDLMVLGPLDEMMRTGFKKQAILESRIAAEKISVSRLIQWVGEGRRRSIKEFVGQMLSGRENINVRMVNSHLRHKNFTTETLLRLFNLGGVTDNYGNPDPTHLMKLLQYAIPESVYDRYEKQRNVQYEENEQLASGEAVAVEEWEFHFVHLEVMEDWMNSREWKALATDQEMRKVTLEHRELHLDAIRTKLRPKVPQQQPPTNGESGKTPQGNQAGTRAQAAPTTR